MNLRYLWRSVSLVFVLWFALFPTLSYASETVIDETYTYDWREAERELIEYSSTSGSSTTWTVDKDDVANGLVNAHFFINTVTPFQNKYMGNHFSWVSPHSLDVYEFSTGYQSYDNFSNSVYKDGIAFGTSLSSIDNTIFIDSGDAFKITVNGMKIQMRYNYNYSWSIDYVGPGPGSGVAYYPVDYSMINSVLINFYGKNDEFSQLSISPNDILTINGDTFGYEYNVQAPDFDVYKIELYSFIPVEAFHWSVPDASAYDSDAYHSGGTNIFIQGSLYNGVLKIEVPDETSGLLSGIIEWLRSIRDGIVNVGSGVTNVFNSILELPSKIWTFIQEGLKMLFIPSEQDISNMHNQWDELMRDRFGAIYESGDIVHSFADTMNVNSAMVADTGGVITMPSVTANLAGTNFTFGGYEVDLVPDGFQWLVTSIKMLINIVCTILFINALKGKIEVLLR